jgi:hypothetical protein
MERPGTSGKMQVNVKIKPKARILNFDLLRKTECINGISGKNRAKK